MDDIESKTIIVNEIITDSLTDDNFRHIYNIKLEKNKYYFITLLSKDDNEFNLRIYDDDKNIIKLKYDDKEENIYLADLNNNLDEENIDDDDDDDDDEEIYDDEDEYELDEVDDLNMLQDDEDDDENDEITTKGLDEMSQNFIDNIISDIISTKLPGFNMDDESKNDPNKIEIIIEMKNDNLPNEDDLEAFLKNSEISSNVVINFNNKMYFTPDKTGNYYLSVTSDYTYQIGEYSLNVQEVEDIKVTYNNKINLDEEIYFNVKDKFKSKKYYVDLLENKSYKISGSENLKFLISKKDQKIISQNNEIDFIAKYSGKYEIEVMLLKKGKSTFKILRNILQDYSEPDYFDHSLDYDKLNSSKNIIKANKIILFDENDDEFELFIKDKKLEIKPHF